MKTVLHLVLTAIFCSVLSSKSYSQISISSNDGYAVSATIQAVNLIPSTNNCPWGFNYNLRVYYKIVINGQNAPSTMYTLQGTYGCGGQQHFFSLPLQGGEGYVITGSNPYINTATCNTATIQNLNCNIVNLSIEARGISARTVSFPAAGVLGIKLAEFSATQENKTVKIKWSTASEENNEYFSVERSVNGGEWKEIQRVKGAGTSTSAQQYTATDFAPATGTSYYRLRQTDFDGKSIVSEGKIVNFDQNTPAAIGIYPVPNTGNRITISGISNFSQHELSVVNASGARVFATQMQQASLELPELTTGFYVITIRNKSNGEVTNLRYVKK